MIIYFEIIFECFPMNTRGLDRGLSILVDILVTEIIVGCSYYIWNADADKNTLNRLNNRNRFRHRICNQFRDRLPAIDFVIDHHLSIS